MKHTWTCLCGTECGPDDQRIGAVFQCQTCKRVWGCLGPKVGGEVWVRLNEEDVEIHGLLALDDEEKPGAMVEAFSPRSGLGAADTSPALTRGSRGRRRLEASTPVGQGVAVAGIARTPDIIEQYGKACGPLPGRGNSIGSAFWRAYAHGPDAKGGLLGGGKSFAGRAHTAGLARRRVEPGLTPPEGAYPLVVK